MTRVYSYTDAAELFATARFPDKGKPVNAWARWFRVGDEYELRVHAEALLRIAPDNTLRFVMSGERARSIAATLSSSINAVVPLLWQREAKGVYRVQHTEKVKQHETAYGFRWYSRLGKDDPKVFNGLTLDLNTLQWLNAKPGTGYEIDPDKRKEWVRAMQAWKRTMKTRAKLGAFDSHVRRLRSGEVKSRYIDWSSKQSIDRLYKAIKDNTCDDDLAFDLLYTSTRPWNPSPTPYTINKHIDSVVRSNSVALRKRFGAIKN